MQITVLTCLVLALAAQQGHAQAVIGQPPQNTGGQQQPQNVTTGGQQQPQNVTTGGQQQPQNVTTGGQQQPQNVTVGGQQQPQNGTQAGGQNNATQGMQAPVTVAPNNNDRSDLDALQKVKVALADFMGEVNQLQISMGQGHDPFLEVRGALTKFRGFMRDMRVDNRSDPSFAFQAAIEAMVLPVGGYSTALHRIKFSLYRTTKVLAEFRTERDLEEASLEKAANVKQAMRDFGNDFRAFIEAQFRFAQPLERTRAALVNMSRRVERMDISQVPLEVYEAVSGLRWSAGRFQDNLLAFSRSYVDAWWRLYEVQDALRQSRCGQASEGREDPREELSLYEQFRRMMETFGQQQAPTTPRPTVASTPPPREPSSGEEFSLEGLDLSFLFE